jgi:hypothetical protein
MIFSRSERDSEVLLKHLLHFEAIANSGGKKIMAGKNYGGKIFWRKKIIAGKNYGGKKIWREKRLPTVPTKM